MTLQTDLEALADEKGFSGVIAVSRDGRRIAQLARGMADRANGRPITLDTRFGIASVTKGLTALTVASLIETGELQGATTLRSLLPVELPLVDPGVTIEHLLGHTSGVGDYLDEAELGDIDDYVMRLPVHQLAAPRDYLPLIDGRPHKSAQGQQFAYNNSGYVMLSIAVEVATGRSFYDLVRERVLDRAGLANTSFARSDEPQPATANGYLADGRTNVLHQPVRGAGDGGAFSTARDLEAMWHAMFDGRILPRAAIERLVEPRSGVPSERRRYGLGFWLWPARETVLLEGMDAGISCRTVHDRPSGLTYAVISNTSSGAWPIARLLDERVPSLAMAGA